MKNLTPREKHRLDNNWNYALKFWKQKKSELKLQGWILKMDHPKTRLGQCDHQKKIVSISSYLMRGPSCNYKKVKQTLLHEIAHILTPGHKHDLIWKKQCIRLGGDGRVSASMDIPGKNWKLICKNCKWRKDYFRKPKLDNKVCMKCKSKPRLINLRK